MRGNKTQRNEINKEQKNKGHHSARRYAMIVVLIWCKMIIYPCIVTGQSSRPTECIIKVTRSTTTSSQAKGQLNAPVEVT